MSKTTKSRSAKSNFIKRAVKRHLFDIETASNAKNINVFESIPNDCLRTENIETATNVGSVHNLYLANAQFGECCKTRSACAHTNISIRSLLDDDVSHVTNGEDVGQISSVTDDDNNEGYPTDDEHAYYPTCSSSDEDITCTEQPTLKELLARHAIKHNITHSAMSDLLKILSKHHEDLPKDGRTLLKTKSRSDITVMKDMYGQNAEYVYIGLENQLIDLVKINCIQSLEDKNIKLLFSIDGLPLYKSSGKQFWPLLCCVKHCENMYKPFVVSLFCGNSKPKDSTIFLADFVAELGVLKERGFSVDDRHFEIHVKAFVCDAPARAFVKCIKGHTAYYGCERCTQKGIRVENRIVFPDINAKKRTNSSFKEQQQEQHHKQDLTSPLLAVDIGHVSQFPLEYMHLVCLGVTRRLLLHWLRGKRNIKISMQIAGIISNEMQNMAKHVTSEFVRKPRSLKDIDRWKASEFRLFLCYIGPLVLRSHLDNKLYHHFMLLHVAIVILANVDMCWTYCDYAEKLIRMFVEQMPELYGNSSLNYTMHSISHICDDVRQFGSLDEYSAFPFENALGIMKRMLRGGRMPLQQLCRRLSERDKQSKYVSSSSAQLRPNLKNLHSKDPTLGLNGNQYERIDYAGFSYVSTNCNNCALLETAKLFPL